MVCGGQPLEVDIIFTIPSILLGQHLSATIWHRVWAIARRRESHGWESLRHAKEAVFCDAHMPNTPTFGRQPVKGQRAVPSRASEEGLHEKHVCKICGKWPLCTEMWQHNMYAMLLLHMVLFSVKTQPYLLGRLVQLVLRYPQCFLLACRRHHEYQGA